jgi:hypothetical protein
MRLTQFLALQSLCLGVGASIDILSDPAIDQSFQPRPLTPATHLLASRAISLHWNQTYITNQRALCRDSFASQQCCPGFCSVDYQENTTSELFYTCCPVGYHAADFGAGSKVDIECCNNNATECNKGSDTKKAMTPFQNPSTNVSFLEQKCASAVSAASSGRGLSLTSRMLPATVALGWTAAWVLS